MGFDNRFLYELYKLASVVAVTSNHHGVEHWTRVERNASYLASKVPDADPLVVRAFALVHDCCREDDGHDPEHGPRAAKTVYQWAASYGDQWGLNRRQTGHLMAACDLHTRASTEDGFNYPLTAQVCFDADRLDLGRVGIAPDPDMLFTHAGRDIASRNAFLWLDENHFAVTAPHHLKRTPMAEETYA